MPAPELRHPPIRYWRTGAIAVAMAALTSSRAAEPTRAMVAQASPYGVSQTVERIEAAARLQGLRVFLRVRPPVPPGTEPGAHADVMVLVLESAQGGTPVLMRTGGEHAPAELPLRLEVRADGHGASHVLIPSDLAIAGDDWLADGILPDELPDGLAQEMAELPNLVTLALRPGSPS